jgi:lipid II:glycine glycyltransferase (peptidoglycan interpeptide bridge formation enzyme)
MPVTRKVDFLTREDVWLDEKPETAPHVDIRYFYHQSSIPGVPNIESDEAHTLLIDLTQDEEKIWKKINRKNRCKIRQAIQKDQVIYDFFEKIDPQNFHEFINFYTEFSMQQGNSKSLIYHEIERLKAYVDVGSLYFSKVKSKEGKALTWQVYCPGKTHVFGLHSASIRRKNDSTYNQMLGRANRYHHWQDILKFKELGFLVYDFGGVYINTHDQKLLNINNFKAEFGGELVRYFNCRSGITLKAKLYLFLRQFLIKKHQTL